MDASVQILDTTATVAPSTVSPAALEWCQEQLGPMPGRWEGYDQISDEEERRQIWSEVGYIHGQSAQTGRTIVEIGQALIRLKERLPHGWFVDCVKAEFGWSRSWAQRLMQIADRFSNVDSGLHLPPSARVLAELAAANATDAVVTQAATEGWTVKETRRRVGSERQRERTLIQEVRSVLKARPEVIALASKAEERTTLQVMQELGLQEPPKEQEIRGAEYIYCRAGQAWYRLPLQAPVEVVAEPAHEPAPPQPMRGTVQVRRAAEILKVDPIFLSSKLSRGGGTVELHGWRITKVGHGKVEMERINPE